MLFVVIAQIVILLVNLAILILSKLTDAFHQLIYIIPVVIYAAAMVAFYVAFLRRKRKYASGVAGQTVVISAIIINVLFAFTEIFIEDPNNPVLFYICTAVAQVINLMFLFNYLQHYSDRIMGASQRLIHKILSYVFVILSLISLYACFVNIFLTVLLLIATSFVASVSIVMFLIASRQ